MSAPPSPLSDTLSGNGHGTLSRILLNRGVQQFEELHALRRQGWTDDSLKLDDHFEQQRAKADNAGAKLNDEIWLPRFRKVFGEIDRGTKCIPPAGTYRFLDMGCCPGGFTSYILNQNPDATGVGISLPVDQGGHPFSLEGHLRPRFAMNFADILAFSLGTGETLPDGCSVGRLNSLPFPAAAGPFDLVILGGNHLRTYQVDHTDTPWDRDRLLIAQMIIALQAVSVGGTLVVKMSNPEVIVYAKVLYILDVLAGRLRLWKSRSLHGPRGTFYAVAKGVGEGRGGERLESYVASLKGLWDELYAGGAEGRGRYLLDSDFDFAITDVALVDEYLPRLIELSKGVWSQQRDALRAWFSKKSSRR